MYRYPLAASTWDSAELEAARSVLESGAFTMGERVASFEQAFARYVGRKYCVMVNSGSSANLLAVACLRYRRLAPLRPGDEVIVPAVSWSTTYSPLHQYGLRIRFVDIDSETLNYDLEALADSITARTRMVVAVDLLGNPNDFDAIDSIIAGRDIVLLEDSCESMGAEYRGRHCGTFGLLGTYSMFFSHHMSTMEGGLIVTDDEELYHILLSLRAHGWTRNLPATNLVCGQKVSDPFHESFRFVLPGYNLRPLEISAAIGIEQLKKLPSFIETRRRNARLFREKFDDHPYLAIQREIGSSSWFGFAILVRKDAPFRRDAVVRALSEFGIESRPIVAGNFARKEVVKWFDHEIVGTLENADWVDSHGLFVGNHHYDLSGELAMLEEAVEQACAGRES